MKKQITNFSFMVFAGLLIASNGALAMTVSEFKDKYGHLEGFQGKMTSMEAEQAFKDAEKGTYIVKPTKLERGSSLLVPGIFYKTYRGMESYTFPSPVPAETVKAKIAELKLTHPGFALSKDAFRAKYGQIKGYTEEPISKFESYLKDRTEYVLRPKEQGVNLFVPEWVYNDALTVKTMQLDPTLTKEQIEQEIKKLKPNGVPITLK